MKIVLQHRRSPSRTARMKRTAPPLAGMKWCSHLGKWLCSICGTVHMPFLQPSNSTARLCVSNLTRASIYQIACMAMLVAARSQQRKAENCSNAQDRRVGEPPWSTCPGRRFSNMDGEPATTWGRVNGSHRL